MAIFDRFEESSRGRKQARGIGAARVARRLSKICVGHNLSKYRENTVLTYGAVTYHQNMDEQGERITIGRPYNQTFIERLGPPNATL